MLNNSETTGDLFPGQNPPRKVDEELEHFVVKACEVTGNHPDDLFCLKVCAPLLSVSFGTAVVGSSDSRDYYRMHSFPRYIFEFLVSLGRDARILLPPAFCIASLPTKYLPR